MLVKYQGTLQPWACDKPGDLIVSHSFFRGNALQWICKHLELLYGGVIHMPHNPLVNLVVLHTFRIVQYHHLKKGI